MGLLPLASGSLDREALLEVDFEVLYDEAKAVVGARHGGGGLKEVTQQSAATSMRAVLRGDLRRPSMKESFLRGCRSPFCSRRRRPCRRRLGRG